VEGFGRVDARRRPRRVQSGHQTDAQEHIQQIVGRLDDVVREERQLGFVVLRQGGRGST